MPPWEATPDVAACVLALCATAFDFDPPLPARAPVRITGSVLRDLGARREFRIRAAARSGQLLAEDAVVLARHRPFVPVGPTGASARTTLR